MSGDMWGTTRELIGMATKRAEAQAAEQEVHDWPGLHQKPGVTAFDVDRLRALASDLSRVHGELSSSGAEGSAGDLTRRANLSQKQAFGNLQMAFCPLTFQAIDRYHQQVLAAVSQEYSNALSALGAVIKGMGLTAQNLGDAEDRSVSSVQSAARVADGRPAEPTARPASISRPATGTSPPAQPPRTTSTPTTPVGPDGSFG